MSKILNVDEMLEAAENSKMPGIEGHIDALEAAATALASDLAKHLKIEMRQPAEAMGEGFGGLCASFGPSKKQQKCPKVIDERDRGGDWD